MARRADKKHFQGFVPAYVGFNQEQCAFYHCALPRWGGRRWCKMHSKQYDKEAESVECTILTLRQRSGERRVYDPNPLDLFPYSAQEWTKLGPFDYVSTCCLAWIDYRSDKPEFRCTDCLRLLDKYTDLESLETCKRFR